MRGGGGRKKEGSGGLIAGSRVLLISPDRLDAPGRPPEYHVVSRRAVDDQKLGCHVDPFSVHRENDFSGSLLDFSAEAYEWGDLSRQCVLLQPQVVVCGLEDNVTGASVVRQYSFHYAVRYSE
ncbi:hypothetical protein F2Q68_00039825 [Brassica cretica]|uniref:Uncharacterized protein n=1 Tax=Brassica cretica TaxID=69181 RepID=A0A8S9MIB0_BRACR|nr:hypothetical protein F2Q68_00039825 [Brassica cretica]